MQRGMYAPQREPIHQTKDEYTYVLSPSTPTSDSVGSPPQIPSTLPPLLPRPIPHHTLPSRYIPIAQQSRNIDIKRRVRLRVRQELVDGCEGCGEGVDGTPVFGCEEGEADFAGREGDVGVGNSGCEVDCWWCEGVVWGNGDAEVPEAAWSVSLDG